MKYVYVLVEAGRAAPLAVFSAPPERPYLLPPDAVSLTGPFLDPKRHVHREVIASWRSAHFGGKVYSLVAMKVQFPSSVPGPSPPKPGGWSVEEILAREG